MAEQGSPGGSLRSTAVIGLIYMGVQSVGVRVLMLGSTIVLGWLLLPEHFGIGTLVGSVAQVAWTLVGFGLDDILVQRGRRSVLWERAIMQVSVGFGTIVALILIALSPLIANMFGEPAMVGLLALTALSQVVSSTSVVSLAKVRRNLDFKWLAGLDGLNVLIGQGLTIVFAFYGFGAYSFFLPIPFQMVVRTILLWHRAPPQLHGRAKKRQMLASTASGLRIVLARVAETLTNEAHYFILGLFAATGIVGLYAFAFRLAVVPVRVLSVNLRMVIVPALKRLEGDRARQDRAGLEACELLAFAVVPISFIQAAVSDPALRLLFGDRWTSSIPLMQLISIGIIPEAILSIVRAQLTTRGEFARAMRYAYFCLPVFVIASVIGASLGQAVGLAIAISVYSFLVTPVMFFRVFAHSGPVLTVYFKVFLLPIMLAAAATFGALGIVRVWPLKLDYLSEILLIGTSASVLYVAALTVFAPQVARRIFDILRSLAPKKRSTP